MTTDNKDYRLYILMRNDLASMSTGRAMAQASHASNAFVHEHLYDASVQSWQNQTTQGFGTAIVLSASASEIANCLVEANERGLFNNRVIDPEWKFEVSREVYNLIDYSSVIAAEARGDNHFILTKREWACAYIFGEYEQTYWVLSKLPLHP
jgi:peptidyl-tRNA hydrolase